MDVINLLVFVLIHRVVGVPNTYSSRLMSDCFLKRGTSLKIRDVHVDKYLSVNTLEECKKECDLTFINCKSFSYKDPVDILSASCLLSREDTNTLDTSSSADFMYDGDFTFYERDKDCRITRTWNSYNGAQARASIDSPDSSRCFKFISTGLRVATRLVSERLRTRDRSECEQECLRATFTCRGFNYRYASLSGASYIQNCELSTQDTYGVDLEDTFVFSRDRDWDFYERRSFSPDCDRRELWDTTNRYGTGSGTSSWRDLDRNWYDSRGRYDTTNRYGNDNYNGNNNNRDCFRFYQRETRLDSRAVRERVIARDLQDCKDSCRMSRSFTCRTLAFSYTSMGSSWFNNYNCYLSDIRTQNLDQFDLLYDKTFDLYAVDEYDRYCNNYNNGYNNGNGAYNPYGREEGFETTSGLQCYRTGCQPDRFNRFYFCETNANGGWDYCCRPGERCQQSVGFGLNWCVVGVRDQDAWRPCSMQSLSSRSFLKEKPEEVKKLKDPKEETESFKPDETKLELRNIEELKITK